MEYDIHSTVLLFVLCRWKSFATTENPKNPFCLQSELICGLLYFFANLFKAAADFTD